MSVDKGLETAAPATEKHKLRRNALGTASIVFFVVAAASPLTGVAGGLPVSFGLGNGAGAAAMYGLATLVLLIFSVGYAAMSRRMINAGAFYAYIGRGIAPWAGIVAAFVAMVSYLGMMIAVYSLYGSSTSDTLNAHFGVSIPWWVLSLVTLLIVASFGHRQVDLSAKVLGVFMLLEVAAILLIGGSIVAQGGASGINLDGFSWDTVSSGAPGVALLFGFASFVGYEATALYGEEVRDPKRTVARATYIAVLLIGAFYVFTTWSFGLGVGTDKIQDASLEALQQNAGPAIMFGQAAEYVGPSMITILEVLLVTSLFAALVAFHNAISRYMFALSREKVFPPFLSVTHERYQSPYKASALTAIIAAAVILLAVVTGREPMLEVFSWTSGVGTLGVILLQAATSLAVFRYFRKNPEPGRMWQTQIAPLLALAGLLGATVLAVSNFSMLAGGSGLLSVVLILVIPATALFGLAVAVIMRSKRPDMYHEVGADMA
ncbi:MAG: APC family permease [Ornithinimicrobium sp.]|uniref:APC family permease n=1 Tax=Ornithinimicrobium sp. TaxID=1977084 RepID=UPI0026DF44A0|nr:APC family permease [Ornithinimicrobium sp.]MDO5741116.1 APC family permease [Ornithinimicrobium sp.]